MWFCAGTYLAKAFFIVLSAYMLVLRCQQECDPVFYMQFERHFLRVEWYIRLFAAAAATASIAAAALLGTWALTFSLDPQTQQPPHPSQLLGAVPNSIAEAFQLNKWLQRLPDRTAAAIVLGINDVVCPAVLVYGVWAFWLPKLPLLQRLYPSLLSSNLHIDL